MLLYRKTKKSRKFRQALTLECPQMHHIFNRILVHGTGKIVFKETQVHIYAYAANSLTKICPRMRHS